MSGTNDFLHTTLGKTGKPVFRLGLSATYRPGKRAILRAVDEGINYFFCYGFDTQMTGTLRDLFKRDRERYVVATGAYNYIWGAQDIRRTLDKRLKQLATDYIDVYQFMGVMKPGQYNGRIRDEMEALRSDGRVRAIAISTHDRKFAGELAAEGAVDALMIRYNAAHRGAERDIFPHLKAHDPGLISYTATRWGYLLRRPAGWPRDGRVPDAGMCYRFVLTNPNVHVCLSAPWDAKQLSANLEAVRRGPLDEDEMRFMCEFGDAVYKRKKWFM